MRSGGPEAPLVPGDPLPKDEKMVKYQIPGRSDAEKPGPPIGWPRSLLSTIEDDDADSAPLSRSFMLGVIMLRQFSPEARDATTRTHMPIGVDYIVQSNEPWF